MKRNKIKQDRTETKLGFSDRRPITSAALITEEIKIYCLFEMINTRALDIGGVEETVETNHWEEFLSITY